MQHVHLQRDLSGEPTAAPRYTHTQTVVLQSLAFTFSLVSIIAVLVSLYWFLRMRRSFRHDLIMILIQSDMFKSLWFMIFAIASFLPGTIESSSIFCQISGFFTAVGIEASVLMIAIHNALYIFRPPTSIGEGGLYRYRTTAIALWLIFPIALASLAFINLNGAYKSSLTTCALPVRPFWYRLALSWVPRYIIFIAILGIDVSIYFYVHRMFGRLNGGVNGSLRRTKGGGSGGRRERSGLRTRHGTRHGIHPTPQLVYNGLIPETSGSAAVMPETHTHLRFKEAQRYRSKTIHGTSIMRWTKATLFTIPHQSAKAATFPTFSLFVDHQNTPTTANLAETTAPEPIARSPSEATTPISGPTPSAQFYPTTPTTASTISFLSFLRLRPHLASQSLSPSSALSELQLVNSPSQNIPSTRLSPQQTRDRIRQQLHLLFIYPLAYLGMWILPFISHVLQYDDRYAKNPPFALTVMVTIVMRAQSAVNCLIFNAKERPWRHRAQDDSLLGQGIAFFRDVTSGTRTSGGLRPPGGGASGGVGISRVAMAAEARMAYQRRRQETAAQASEVGEVGRGGRRERSWWDGPEMTAGGDPGEEYDEGEEGRESAVERRDGVGIVRLAGEES